MLSFRKKDNRHETHEYTEADIINIVSVCENTDNSEYSICYETDNYENLTPQELLIKVKIEGKEVKNAITTEMVKSCNSWQELEEKTIVKTCNKLYHGRYSDISEVDTNDIIKVIGSSNYAKWKEERKGSDRLKEAELLKLFWKLPKSVRNYDSMRSILEAMIKISEDWKYN